MSADCASEVGEGAAQFIDELVLQEKIDMQLLEGISHKYPKKDVHDMHGATGSAATPILSSIAGDNTLRRLMPEEDRTFSSALEK